MTSLDSRNKPYIAIVRSSILILKSPEAFISMLLILLKPLAALLQSEFMYLPCAYQNVTFNSRPCERGFASGDSSSCMCVLFQFTPLREGLQLEILPQQLNNNFNSRPCERGFNSGLRTVDYASDFNSRPCERGFG